MSFFRIHGKKKGLPGRIQLSGKDPGISASPSQQEDKK
jgi:hypothetical protein